MNVCILTSSFPRNPEDPAGIFVYNLAKWLAKKNINITVLAPHHKGCKFIETRDAFTIFRFPYFFPFGLQKLCYGSGIIKNINEKKPLFLQIPFFFLSQAICASVLIKKLRADIIHAHWSIPQGLIGVVSKKILNIPCITTLHGSDIFSMKNPQMKALNAWILTQSDSCTANSTQTTGAAEHLCCRKDLIQIPMGVDTEFFAISDEQRKLTMGSSGRNVIYAGRLIDWKGVEYLIKAMPKVIRRYPDTQLTIVGDGPERERLFQSAKESGMQDHLIFTGSLSQEELRRYYTTADVFVLPSIVNGIGETEGLGVVLLEAMACGVPVIGTDAGGICDIIKHETTGLMVPQKHPAAISDSILRLFEDHDLRSKLIDNGRRLVETHFSWDIISDRFIQIYRNMVIR